MENRGGRLFLGGVSAADLVQEYGSPLFVMEEDRILENLGRLRSAFDHPAIRVFYAMKANPNGRIVKLLHSSGAGIDCCSVGEVHAALRAGVPPGDLSFTGTALKPDEAGFLGARGISTHVDALSQVERFLPLFSKGLGIRLNPGVGAGLHPSCTTGGHESKLGIPWEHAGRAREIAARLGGRIVGLHVHTGSGGLDVEHFKSVARMLFELASEFSGDLEHLDLGGGMGVPHSDAESPFAIDEYGAEVRRLLDGWNRTHERPIRLFVEPGQYLVSEAGWLLMQCVVRKETPRGMTFLITDSSFNHYLGTALYQSYHEFLKAESLDERPTEVASICGNLCNTGDTFAKDRPMPRVEEGDLLAMVNAGAYGLSRAANYNSRAIPAEILVSRGRSRLIRRRQTLDDLLLWQE